MLYTSNFMINVKLTISGTDKIFQECQCEIKDYSLFTTNFLAKPNCSLQIDHHSTVSINGASNVK